MAFTATPITVSLLPDGGASALWVQFPDGSGYKLDMLKLGLIYVRQIVWGDYLHMLIAQTIYAAAASATPTATATAAANALASFATGVAPNAISAAQVMEALNGANILL